MMFSNKNVTAKNGKISDNVLLHNKHTKTSQFKFGQNYQIERMWITLIYDLFDLFVLKFGNKKLTPTKQNFSQ